MIFFLNGVKHYLNNLPLWKDRKSTVFWRGGVSGGQLESIRCRTVHKLLDYPDSDVKLTRGWELPNVIPDNFFSDRVNYRDFLDYKIFLVIDGNCIASSHMWAFGTGCVPLIISDAKCWFNKFLIPFVNYIPINYDLSNLIEQIEWVKNNDAEAEQIGKNALQFAYHNFSPSFQEKYLIDEIVEYLNS